MLDIETTPGFDPQWGRVILGCIKPWGGEVETYGPHKNKVTSDDSVVVGQLIDRLNQFSIIVAHNGVYFDVPYLNSRAVAQDRQCVLPGVKVIDPVKIARRHLNLGRNSLDAIASYLSLDEQKYHIPGETWVKASLDSDKDSIKLLKERCASDVRVLEAVAARFLPLTRNLNGWGSA